MTKIELFNIVLIHTARTWERIRVAQPFEELAVDNIASTDIIEQIAHEIVLDKVLVKFLASEGDWEWSKETDTDFSDIYIEGLAENKIKKIFKLN